MKNILFDSFGRLPGGFPVRGETFKFVQDMYQEIISALAGDVPANVPVIVSGLVATSAAGLTTITEGWFFYNDNIYYSAGGTATDAVPGNIIVMHLVETIVQDDFKNLPASVDVYKTVVGTVGNASAAGSTALDWAGFVPWMHYVIKPGSGVWKTIILSGSIATGAILSGSLQYRKNQVTQRLEIIGSATVSNAQALAPNNYYTQLCLIPGVEVLAQSSFTAQYRYHNAIMYDYANTNVMYGLNGDMYPDGSGNTAMLLGWVRPDTAVTYTVHINTTAPLA